ncbi:phosphonate ABC transporter, permease protein PhnE [Chthonobacter albigriseus]|uniref:phosphonate ABC transporter, permease protein PhnE n=1 Tax=Chthonobacter albigriseus TaxID=1683161 RepID=UPI0015EED01D|nr:phosphonate ABC transporter, permease protein PhnE [Chthonobacter albigriseus]
MALALSPAEFAGIRSRHPLVFQRSWKKRSVPFLVVGGTILYVLYAWWFFAIGAVLSEGRWDRAGAYLADWVSYDVRPTLRFKGEGIEVTYPRFNVLGDNPDPDWVRQVDGRTVEVDVGGARIAATPDLVTITHAGETLEVDLSTGTPTAAEPVPGWAVQKEDEVDADFGFTGSVEIKANRVAIEHRFLGWANFIFDPNSPFFGRSTGEVISLILWGDRLDPDVSNAALAFDNFWNNGEWQHGDVYAKLLQTIIMAFVGTVFAGLVAFPFAFLAARNITPSRLVNHAAKRFFDFQRTIDGLIWALFFIRAFGPGPIPGIAAIFFTDIGSLGKLYAEALENIDEKQREGIRSVGAPPSAVQRFGVLPQVLPVFLSQALYYLESNTRSATIIGAVGAGGIGLKLLEAMRTNQDWENVFYMVILILVVVYAIDGISGALRSRLAGNDHH